MCRIPVSEREQVITTTQSKLPLLRACGLCWFVLVLGVHSVQSQDDDYRTWQDASGRYQVDAFLLSQTDTHVTLENRDGQKLTVAKSKLCEIDLAYLDAKRKKLTSGDKLIERSKDKIPEATARHESSQESATPAKPASLNLEQRAIKKLAQVFFADLRTKKRSEAKGILTEKAQSLVEQELSALLHLPSPDNGSQAIRVGTPSIAGEEASVIVSVQVGQRFQKTMLELRREEDEWRVNAISARRGDVEATLDFETPYQPGEEKKDTHPANEGIPVEISGITLDGRKVSLSDFKGKVVLVDFWATWCGPCIAEIPNVYENYLNYHEKGFEVIAISLDRDMEELQKFIFEKKPPWPVLADRHPSNPQSMASKYGIRAIPTMFLIGPDGKIIDPNCRGPKLSAKLAEIFGR